MAQNRYIIGFVVALTIRNNNYGKGGWARGTIHVCVGTSTMIRVQKPEVTRSEIRERTTVHQRHIRDQQDLATQSSRSVPAVL